MMLPDVSDTLARLSMDQIGQIEPGLCELEKMRLIGRIGSPASKFDGHYGVSSVFVFFSDHGGTRVSMALPLPATAHKHDSLAMRSGNCKKIGCSPHSSDR
jgi:hypothetical protein